MAARPSMAALIAKVRKLIRDKAAPVYFDDDEIQDALDHGRRTDAQYAILTPLPTVVQPGGVVTYLTYAAGDGDWEDDLVFSDAGFGTIAPSGLDQAAGKWVFAVSTPPPVRVTGKFYDLYGAAADLLTQRAADPDLGVDTTTEAGATIKVDQQASRWLTLADRYLAKAKPGRSTLFSGEDLPDELAWPSSVSGLPGTYYS